MKKIQYCSAFIVNDEIINKDITLFNKQEDAYRFKKSACEMGWNAIVEITTITTEKVVDRFNNPLKHKKRR